MSRGKVASGEGADKANQTLPTETTRRRKVNLKMEGRREVKPAPMERCEVNSEVEDDAKSNPHNPKFISRPMDLENTLSESQQPPTTANMAKPSNLPFRQGIGPLTLVMHNPRLRDERVTRASPL